MRSRTKSEQRIRGRPISPTRDRSARPAANACFSVTTGKFATRAATPSRRSIAAAAGSSTCSPAITGRSCPSAPRPVATSRRGTTHIEGQSHMSTKNLKIISADERLSAPRGGKLVIAGPTGVGKTSLLRTVNAGRALLLDSEAGDLSIQDVPVATIRLDDWQIARDA